MKLLRQTNKHTHRETSACTHCGQCMNTALMTCCKTHIMGWFCTLRHLKPYWVGTTATRGEKELIGLHCQAKQQKNNKTTFGHQKPHWVGTTATKGEREFLGLHCQGKTTKQNKTKQVYLPSCCATPVHLSRPPTSHTHLSTFSTFLRRYSLG